MDTKRAVAIVGIACRFPGVDSLEDYWKLLVNGENNISEIPSERWSTSGFYNSDKNAPGKSYAKHAGIIDNVLDWDNKLFGINVYEAEKMDPQQKLALEVTYRAFENGGFSMNAISGSKTAVYMGVMNADYAGLLGYDPTFYDNYSSTGLGNSILANRISFIFNLNGPSVTLDTACSSGMMAQHLGVQSILSGESTMAVCGGVTVILSPLPFVTLSKARMASESGQCKTYSADADGYVRSEGCGILILKDLEMAREDGDHIWGVMTTASNSDGKVTNPMTAPSSDMQAALMRNVLKEADLEPSQIDFVEMHGTGTSVGDPVECSSIGRVMGAARKLAGFPHCPIGSVKTNLGHSEAAAGPAGLIKALLMLKYGKIVPSILFGKLNQNLNIDELHLDIVLNVRDWPNEERPRLVSVNSFGFGGSNVHAILQSHSATFYSNDSAEKDYIVLFTGQDKQSLVESAKNTSKAIKAGHIESLKSLSYTSCYFRTLFQYRKAVTAKSLSDLASKIESVENSVQTLKPQDPKSPKEKSIVMVFCGMGSHWIGMGLQMYTSNSTFRNTIDQLNTIFIELGNIDIIECLKGIKDLTNPLYGQPALFACQVALFNAWVEKGIIPSVVIGHSVGEVAAAFASGCLSLKEAANVVFCRGYCVSKVRGGKMLVVGRLTGKKILSEIEPFGEKVDIAAYNSETSFTLSGDSDAILALGQSLPAKYGDSIFVRILDVQVAYHSFYMNGVLKELSFKLENSFDPNFTPKELKKHISTVTGNEISIKNVRSQDYWLMNVRKSVLFSTALRKAVDLEKLNVIIEVGPKPALRTNIKEIAKDATIELLPSMHVSNENLFNNSVEKCFELAISYCPSKQGELISPFPRYAFQRSRIYKEPLKATSFKEGKTALVGDKHPFVQKQDGSLGYAAFVSIEPSTTEFVFEHKLSGVVIVPGATYVEMGIACIKSHSRELDDAPIEASVQFLKPGVVSGNKKEMLVTVFLEESSQCLYSFDITANEVMHAKGTIRKTTGKYSPAFETKTLLSLQKRLKINVSPDIMYEKLAKKNFTYGPSLRCIESGSMSSSEALVTLKLPPNTDIKRTTVHPVVLDTILQLSVIFPATDLLSHGQLIPFGIEKLCIYKPLGGKMLLHVKLSDISEHGIKMNAVLLTENGEIILHCLGLTYGIIGMYSSFDARDILFQMHWEETANSRASSLNANSIIAIATKHTTHSLTQHLGVTLHCVNFEDILKETLFRDHAAFKDLLPSNTSAYGGIIYFPQIESQEGRLDQLTGQDLKKMVIKFCFPFLQLIKYTVNIGLNIPIFLVTTGVYTLFAPKTPNANVANANCLIGAALLGMARTINKEYAFQTVKAVDVECLTKTNLEIMGQVILCVDDYFEVAIQEGKYLVGALLDSKQKLVQPNFPYFYSEDEVVTIINNNGKYFTEAVERPKSDATGYETVKTLQVLITTGDLSCDTSRHFRLDTGDQALLASDFLVRLPNGAFASVCAILNVATEVYVRKSSIIEYETFPCDTPCLSYWLNAYNLVKTIDNTLLHFLLLESDDPLQATALKWVCKLCHINIISTYEENTQYGGIIMIASDTENVSSQLGMLKDRELNIFLLLTDNCNFANISSNPRFVRIINAYHTLMCNDHAGSLEQFINWLNHVRKEELKQALKHFCSFMKNNVSVMHFTEYVDFARTGSSPILLSFKAVPENPNVKCVSSKNVLRKNATYIVFGGSKGLGWEVVKHIASNGAGVICIVSRSGIQEDKSTNIKAIEVNNDCKIIDLKGDVTDMRSMKKIFHDLQERFSFQPIRGIFFGAAVTCDALIPSMTMEKFQKALEPKVVGVWNIYNLVNDIDLDFFVIHSSIASLFGNAGQTNYSAGNAFEDAVARLRKLQTGVGLSICWGALDLGILHDNRQAMKKVQSMGLIPLKPKEIMQCLDYGMGLIHESVICFANFAWKTWFHWINNSSALVLKQYTPLLDRHCHFMQSSSISSQPGADLSRNAAKETIKQLLFLEDSDFSMQSTLIDLGADSHQMQLFQSKLMNDFGVSSEHIPIVKIGQMQIAQIFDLVSPGEDKDANVITTNLSNSPLSSTNSPSSSFTTVEEPIPKPLPVKRSDINRTQKRYSYQVYNRIHPAKPTRKQDSIITADKKT